MLNTLPPSLVHLRTASTISTSFLELRHTHLSPILAERHSQSVSRTKGNESLDNNVDKNNKTESDFVIDEY